MGRDGGIGVVGAGPSGLAAAWWLASRGVAVTMYESRAVGGGLRTESLGGTSADAVVQLVSDGYTRLREVAEGVGAGHLLVPAPGRDAVWRRGRAHGVRYGSILSMAASGSLPGLLKVRLGTKYVGFLERHADVLDLNDPSRASRAGLDTESIAEWGVREMGRDFVELLCYPLLTSYYGVTPEETGAGVFHALARAGLRVQLLGIRGGASALARAVADWLGPRGVEVRAGRRVESLDADGQGVRLRVGGDEARHDGVVVAVPAREAARLLPATEWLGSVRSRSTATLILGLDRPLGTGWFGLSIPRGELPGDEVAAVCVQEEKGTGVAAGRGALTVVPTPHAGETWAVSDPGHALEATLRALDVVLPAARSGITEARLVRLPESTFVPGPGHFGRVPPSGPAGLPARVALAGDYLVAPTVEGAVRSGLRAAERVMAATGP